MKGGGEELLQLRGGSRKLCHCWRCMPGAVTDGRD